MKIGVIGGNGVVGRAIVYGMRKLGHDVKIYDPSLPETKWKDILDTEINFICVPTKSNEDGSCDTSIVGSTVENLINSNYKGIAVIKSTVIPGTTEALCQKYSFEHTKDCIKSLEICFVPEFLRERCAEIDFVENHDVCIIGTNNIKVFEKIKEAHGRYPRQFIRVSPTEAEFCKYFNNVYNATLVTFANSMYELCKSVGADYTAIKNAIVHRDHITDIYLDCNENFRGFGGMCLPKDTSAIAYLSKLHIPNVNFFDMILKENAKYKTTVFEGMRK